MSILGGLLSLGAGLLDIGGESTDAENAAAKREDDRELSMWQTDAARQDQLFGAELGLAQFGATAANQASMFNASAENQVSTSMWAPKYNVAYEQARFDAFQAEFGDMKENVNNYFRSLSASSVKAQNIDDINGRMAGVDARLTQTLAEKGISSNSPIAIAAMLQTDISGETEKVLVNRNVDTEIAGVKQDFLTAQANNPLLARAPDFEAGMLTDEQKASMVTKYNPVTGYAIPEQQELPEMPGVTPPQTGVSSILGNIF